MKYLSHIGSFLLGGAIFTVGSTLLFPPTTLDIGIEIGRKLGLAAAEARYAEYQDGHAALTVQAQDAEKLTDAAEESLEALRKRSITETNRLKEVATEATQAQDQAIAERVGLQEELDSAWTSLDESVSDSDQVVKDAVALAKRSSRIIYDNLKLQLEAADQWNDSLRLQLDLKEQEVLALSASLLSWTSLAETEKKLRKDAEAYISDVKDSGFYFGIGAMAGMVKTISGDPGPGIGVGLTAGWRF